MDHSVCTDHHKIPMDKDRTKGWQYMPAQPVSTDATTSGNDAISRVKPITYMPVHIQIEQRARTIHLLRYRKVAVNKNYWDHKKAR